MIVPAEFLTTLKSISTVVGAALLIWNLFRVLQIITDTAKKIPQFMETVIESLDHISGHAQKAVDNHLTHIESGVADMATSTDKLATNIAGLQGEFQKFVVEDAKATTLILERLSN